MNNILDPNEVPEILDEIREIGGKYIIVENGKPAFVILGVEEYKRLKGLKKDKNCCSGKVLIDKINAEIADWKMKQQDVEEEDYEKYIPERFRNKEEKDEIIEEDLAYHYDVDEDEDNWRESYDERNDEEAPF